MFKRNKFVLVFIIIVVFIVTILHTNLKPDLYFLTFDTLENTSCHYVVDGDALPQIEESLDLPSKSIFFHETSCHGRLNSRQSCAIESAARTHPEWQINVFFSGPVTEWNLNSGNLKALKQFKNVQLFRLHLVDYAKGTPVEDMVRHGALNRSLYRVSHTSDLLRYLSLYKWGGVYLDLDVVVMKSFEDGLVNNWAARESDTTVASFALSFSRDQVGRTVADAAIRDFKSEYRGDNWGNNGPGVITRILKQLCSTNDVTKMSADTCNGFDVYGPELFCPVRWQDAEQYFTPGDLPVGDAYTHHVWNKLTQDSVIKKEYPYVKLAKKYCPTIYELNGEHFGL